MQAHFLTTHSWSKTWRNTDPTTLNRQGNDVGTQYASLIFCQDEKQKKIAQNIKDEVQRLVDAGKIKYAGKTVHTPIVDANPFYPAHEEHQAYLEKNPTGYCNHFYRFKDWPVLNWKVWADYSDRRSFGKKKRRHDSVRACIDGTGVLFRVSLNDFTVT